MKHLVFDCRYVEPFQSYALPIDGGLAKVRQNLRFFPAIFVRDGLKKFLQVGFQA